MRNLLKNRFGALAVAVALTGAFATEAMTERNDAAAPKQGYVRLSENPQDCQQEDMCTDVSTGILCTVDYNPSGAQLFGKDEAGECTETLWRPIQ